LLERGAYAGVRDAATLDFAQSVVVNVIVTPSV
jgi:hypothetical protein